MVIQGDGKPAFEEGNTGAGTGETGTGGGTVAGGFGGGGDVEAPFTSISNISWRQGRQLLRQ